MRTTEADLNPMGAVEGAGSDRRRLCRVLRLCAGRIELSEPLNADHQRPLRSASSALMCGLETRMTAFEARMIMLDARMTALDLRMGALQSRMTMMIWAMGLLLTVTSVNLALTAGILWHLLKIR
jgi:hypothetical protein